MTLLYESILHNPKFILEPKFVLNSGKLRSIIFLLRFTIKDKGCFSLLSWKVFREGGLVVTTPILNIWGRAKEQIAEEPGFGEMSL